MNALLAAAQDGKFDSSPCFHHLVSPDESTGIHRSQHGATINDPRLVFLISHYLGGNEEDIWVNEVDRGARRIAQGDVIALEMRGRDMFVQNSHSRNTD